MHLRLDYQRRCGKSDDCLHHRSHIDQSNQLSFRYHKRKDMILVVSINYRSRFIIVKFELCVIIEKLTINFFFVLILLYASIVYHNKWKIYNNCFFNKIITEKGMNISNREI